MKNKKKWIARQQEIVNGARTAGRDLTAEEQAALDGLDRYKERFCQAMDDDFNTADAISVLFELVRELNTALQGRGGGKPFFAQGSVSASRAAIEAFFRERGE